MTITTNTTDRKALAKAMAIVSDILEFSIHGQS